MKSRYKSSVTLPGSIAALSRKRSRLPASLPIYLNIQIAQCDAFLAIIGPNWLHAKDESGGRRIDNPDDFVAIEIAAAFGRNIPVIPVLIDGARMPKATELPEAHDALRATDRGGANKASQGDEAEEFLRTILANGAVPVATLEEEAKSACIAWRTINRAKHKLRIRSEKSSMKAGWVWTFTKDARNVEGCHP